MAKKKKKTTQNNGGGMATRDEQLAILSAELANDPLGRGYSGMSDAEAADNLNVRDRPTTAGDLSLRELWEDLIDQDEATTLRTGAINEFNNIVLLGQNAPLSVTATDYAEIGLAFPGGSQTRINMNNRAQGLESRGEELDLPRPIKEGWVNTARAS